MNISMDGLRSSLSTVYNDGVTQINKLEVGEEINSNNLFQLRSNYNELRKYIKLLNSISDKNQEDFHNMSDQYLADVFDICQ